jgi:hypothetical protein
MSLTNELRSRYLPKFDKYSVSKAVKPHLWAALDAIDQIAEMRATIDADKMSSQLGKTQQLRDFAPTLAPAVAKARGAIAGAKEAIERQREGLMPRVKDRNDVASAMLRSDFRRFNQGRPVADIIRTVESDPTAMEALFEGPPELNGLTSEIRGQILKAYLERHAGELLAAISDQTSAVDLLETGVNKASQELADAAGVYPNALDSWLLEKAPKDAAKLAASAFAPPAPLPRLVKSESTTDDFHERLLAEGRAEIALIMAS